MSTSRVAPFSGVTAESRRGAQSRVQTPEIKESLLGPDALSVTMSDSALDSDSTADIPVPPPPDKHGMAYIIFFILGNGSLFPWNAFLTALDFFETFYKPLHAGFTFPFIFNLPNCVFGLLMIAFGHRLRQTHRILGSLIIVAFCMQVMSTLVIVKAETAGSGIHILLYVLIVLLGACGAVNTASVLSVAAYFPPVYTQAFISGQGMSGLVLAVLRVSTKAAFNNDDSGTRTGSLIYFESSVFVLLVCIAAYVVLLKLPITEYYTKTRVEPVLKRRGYGDLKTLTNLLDPEQAPTTPMQRMRMTMRYVWKSSLAVFSVFLVTLTVFPGLVAAMPIRLNVEESWYPLILISLFMIGDVLSRVLTSCFTIKSPTITHALVATRFVFVFFFLIPETTKWDVPDWLTMAAVFVMALSNGYLVSLLMMFGPSKVPTELKGTAGIIMGVSLSMGILAGSTVAFIFHLAFPNL